MSPVAAHDLLQLPTERASAREGGYLWNLEYPRVKTSPPFMGAYASGHQSKLQSGIQLNSATIRLKALRQVRKIMIRNTERKAQKTPRVQKRSTVILLKRRTTTIAELRDLHIKWSNILVLTTYRL